MNIHENQTENKSLESFTNLYSISKTLRFELVPQPENDKYKGTNLLIRNFFDLSGKGHHKMIEKDYMMAKSYKHVKRIIDCMHRNIIDEKLNEFKFTEKDLNTLYQNDAENDIEVEDEKDKFKKIRETISEKLYKKTEKSFKYSAEEMFNLKLINPTKKGKCLLEEWLEEIKANEDKKKKYLDDIINEIKEDTGENKEKVIKEDTGKNKEEVVWKIIDEDIKRMKGWFTYFKGYNENRKNVYSADKISTAIPYRIVHVNFPIFKRNIENYHYISKNYPELKELIDSKGAAEIFNLDYYNSCLTQEQIDNYNEKIGNISKEQGKEQDKGINQIINEYVQKENKRIKEENERIENENKNLPENQRREKLKKIKVAVFEKLKKQIMGRSKTKSFQFEFFESTQDVINGIKERLELLEKNNLFDEVKRFLIDVEKADLDEVYVNERFIGEISKKLFDNGRYIEFALEKWYDDKINRGIKDKKAFLEAKQFSIKQIEDAINHYLVNYEQDEDLKNKFKNNPNPIANYFKNPTITVYLNEMNKNGKEFQKAEKNLFEELELRKNSISHIISGTYNKELQEEKDNGEDVEMLKSFLDALLEFHNILKPFNVKDKNLTNSEFYHEFNRLQEEIDDVEILSLYNQTRNYITKKSYKLDKFKLNFENQQLLEGWSKDKEKDYRGVLLRKGGMYYLAIVDSNSKNIFDTNDIYSEDGEYEKMTMSTIKWKTLTGKAYTRDFGDKYSSHVFDYYVEQYKNYLSKNEIEIKDLDKWIEDENSNKNEEKKRPNDKKVLKKIINYIEKNLKGKNIEILIDEIKNISDAPCTPVIENLKTLIKKQFITKYPILNSFLDANFESRNEFEEWKNTIAKEIYRVNFDKRISEKKLLELATPSNGKPPKIYLFRIHNKDYRPGHNGLKNLHTLYWEILFDEKNINNTLHRLNGKAEIFYREASILKNPYSHQKGEKVPKKFLEVINENGKVQLLPVPGDVIKRLNNYFKNNIPIEQWKEEDKKYKDNYSIVKKENGIVKDERFTKDKILFHCPITLNFKNPSKRNINGEVLNYLYQNRDIHIIGIDRGERHLLYLTMINQEGKIVQGMQFSLNELEKTYSYFENGNKKTKVQTIDFLNLLNQKEGSRMAARKNWQTIENISNLKQGYLSLVIHKLAKLIVEKNAIVVLEDLNYGFKDSRAKVEKNIYQKFEKMLIDKLNYLVIDKNNLYDNGGVMKGYQLTNPISAYKDISKQCGILFYVPPDYTSKICPRTGFVKLINTQYTGIKDAKELLKNFNIYYDKNHNYFRFDFDYKNLSKFFNTRKINIENLKNTKWSLCSHDATRTIKEKINNKWISNPVNINEKLEKLIESRIPDYKYKESLTNDICSINDKDFFEKILKYLTALFDLRHTWKDDKGFEHDIIVSSVEYAPNQFFVSSKEKDDMPQNADANGAYHIALKGLLLLKRLDKLGADEFEKTKKSKDGKSQWLTNEEWLRFVQSKAEIKESVGM